MTRYKGRQSAKSIERDFPHFVEIAVPLGGLGKALDAMYEFHKQCRIQAKVGRARRDDGAEYVRWRFASLEIAKSFTTVFAASE